MFIFKEINSLKSTISTQKLTFEENFQEEKVRLKTDEERKQQELEDRLRALNLSKDELEVKFTRRIFIHQSYFFNLVEIQSTID